MFEKVLVPYISIRPNCLTYYERLPNPCSRSLAQIKSELNLKTTSHNGKMSVKAKIRIENAINWMLATVPRKRFFSKRHNKHFYFKVNFITLTLASKQMHDDNTIKKELLNQFLTEIRQQFKVKKYLWRAEPQRNGNIHFHILTDQYIHYKEIQTKWNRIQDKLGYVKRYTAQSGKIDPPSTEVKSIKHVKNLAKYLSKYCTKENKERPIQGKQWGLSQNLSKFQRAVTIPCIAMVDELRELRNVFFQHYKQYDYCCCLYVHVNKWKKVIKGLLYNEFLDYKLSIDYY